MSNNRERSFGTYNHWMGMPVHLNIMTGDTSTSLFCTIIGESDDAVRVRLAGEWDVDIYKEMIQVVDAFPRKGMELAPQSA